VHSLSRRLLVSVSVPLALFFGVMMVVLDTGFRELSERSGVSINTLLARKRYAVHFLRGRLQATWDDWLVT